MTVRSCSCGGSNANCAFCFGRGYIAVGRDKFPLPIGGRVKQLETDTPANQKLPRWETKPKPSELRKNRLLFPKDTAPLPLKPEHIQPIPDNKWVSCPNCKAAMKFYRLKVHMERFHKPASTVKRIKGGALAKKPPKAAFAVSAKDSLLSVVKASMKDNVCAVCKAICRDAIRLSNHEKKKHTLEEVRTAKERLERNALKAEQKRRLSAKPKYKSKHRHRMDQGSQTKVLPESRPSEISLRAQLGNHERIDRTKDYGFPARESGRYGSHPLHDGFDDESGPE